MPDMKIALDNQIFSLQDRGGISRYFCELGAALISAGDDVAIASVLHRNLHLEECKALASGGTVIRGRAGAIASSLAPLLSRVSEVSIAQMRPDVLHLTYYKPPVRRRHVHPVLVTVHDMIPELYPSMTSRRDPAVLWKRDAVLAADHIICVSHNTKKELLAHVEVCESKISVVHHGVRPFTGAIPGRPHSRPYVLYVGNRDGYKNFSTLIKAFGARTFLRETFDVVALGGPMFDQEERAEISRANVQAFRYSGGDDALLAAFYRHAAAFIYPSLHEGFGMPPLEAMAHMCPVIASSESSIPEVVGDAAMQVDPRDVDAMADAIDSVLYSPGTSAALVQRGKERVRHFTWEKCATETRAAYLASIAK
jgi:glycosyltransferase involved in cell wall biosynthesis